jgi:hypothetical protein
MLKDFKNTIFTDFSPEELFLLSDSWDDMIISINAIGIISDLKVLLTNSCRKNRSIISHTNKERYENFVFDESWENRIIQVTKP